MCGRRQSEETHKMLLIALIEDRKASLHRKGIASIYLEHDTDMKTFRDECPVQHVFTSPETQETLLSH